MPTQVYKLSNGKRVPGVTTVLGNIGWSRRALMIWANRLGLEGIELDSPEATKAADVGTLAHAYGQAWLEAGCPLEWPLPPPESDLEKQAQMAFLSLPRWWGQQRLAVVAAELPLVSEVHRFGGTMDLVARDEAGDIHVIDFKTGKDVYPEMLGQIRAYGELYREHNPGDYRMHYSLLRWGREGDFHHHSYETMDDAWEMFSIALRLHDLKKKLDP